MRTNGHVTITWPAIGAVVAFLVALITGTIRLGVVQTHVDIDSSRIDRLEEHERLREIEHLAEAIAAGTVKARQDISERAISQIQQHDVETRDRESIIQERLSKVEATAQAADKAITAAAAAAAVKNRQ